MYLAFEYGEVGGALFTGHDVFAGGAHTGFTGRPRGGGIFGSRAISCNTRQWFSKTRALISVEGRVGAVKCSEGSRQGMQGGRRGSPARTTRT